MPHALGYLPGARPRKEWLGNSRSDGSKATAQTLKPMALALLCPAISSPVGLPLPQPLNSEVASQAAYNCKKTKENIQGKISHLVAKLVKI